ncbi:ABC transporter substrate-binding protein [Paenibacillus sp. GYB004]|uniref:ABC transporter substrate-binding protein n=1 Tax=Paenibacillus sp. GYB004 TaxID=2994393 RepID=UPI002F96CF19
MKTKKRQWLGFSLALCIGVLSGCSGGSGTGTNGGGGSSGTGGGESPASAPAPAASTEPVELVFWFHVGSITNNEGFMSAFGNKIKEKFPHVTPKFIAPSNSVNLKSLVESKQPIDIFYDAYGQIYSYLMEYNLQYDISGLIQTHKYDVSRLEPTAVAAMRQIAGGGMYGLPVTVDSVNLIYNKTLFERFGVPAPKDGMTWDDVYELTRKMSRTESGVQYYGMGMSPGAVANGDPLSPVFIDPVKHQGLFASEKPRRMFETLTQFYRIAGNEVDSTTSAYATQLKLFSEQRLAMMLGPNALGTRYFADKDPNLEWDIVSYPRYKEAPNAGPQLAPGYFLIPVTSTHKETAFQVAAYVTSEEFQKHLARRGYSPALQGTDIWSEYGKDLPYMRNKHLKAMIPDQPAPIAPLSKYQALAAPEFTQIFHDIATNAKDINTALREADERINKKIAEQMAK